MSPECTSWSRMQQINVSNAERPADLVEPCEVDAETHLAMCNDLHSLRSALSLAFFPGFAASVSAATNCLTAAELVRGVADVVKTSCPCFIEAVLLLGVEINGLDGL